MLVLVIKFLLVFASLTRFYADSTSIAIPAFPRYLSPIHAGGILPSPTVPDPQKHLKPGMVVIKASKCMERISGEKDFRGQGKGRLWTVSYEFIVAGPNGIEAIYIDRNAILLSE